MNVSCPDCRSIFRVDPAKVPPNGVRARCSVCSGVITIPAPSGANTPTVSAPRTATPPATAAPFNPPSAPFTPPVPPPPPRSAEMPAPPRRREESGPITATATPPSPAGVPEFRSPPAPFVPGAAPGSGGPFVPGAPPARPAPPPAPPAPPAPAASAPVPSPAAAPRRAAPPVAPPPPPPVAQSAPPAPTPRASTTPPGGTASVGDARRPLNPFLSKDPNQRAKRLARALVSDIITYHPAKHAEGLRDGTLKQLFREEIKKSFEEYIAQVGQQLAEGTTYFQEALNEVLAGGKKIF